MKTTALYLFLSHVILTLLSQTGKCMSKQRNLEIEFSEKHGVPWNLVNFNFVQKHYSTFRRIAISILNKIRRLTNFLNALMPNYSEKTDSWDFWRKILNLIPYFWLLYYSAYNSGSEHRKSFSDVSSHTKSDFFSELYLKISHHWRGTSMLWWYASYGFALRKKILVA
jgi:hypothetical protein